MDIPSGVLFSPQPLGWSYQAYNLLTLVLSSIFIVCLFVMYSISRSVSILPHAFRMVTLEKRRMHCFDVDITSGRQAHKVRMLYMWMLRAAILVMFCFVWQYCVVSYKAIDFAHPRGPVQLYQQCVRWESDCFGEKQHQRFFSFNANPTNVCTQFKEISENQMGKVVHEILEQHRYVLCVHFISPDAMVYTAGLSIAFALGYLILTGFEVLVWLLYRATERWLPLLVFMIGIAVFGFWIGSLFIPQFFTFFGCWISFIMVLTVPWILWLALAAAYNLRKLQHQKWALWQEQANRPLDQLMDRGRRESEISGQNVAARGLTRIHPDSFTRHDLDIHRDCVPSSPRLRSCVTYAQQGSGEASGGDLDVDMDDLAALKASKICSEGQEGDVKKKNEGHFELPNVRGIKMGIRQKKEKSSQPSGTESGGLPFAQQDSRVSQPEANQAKGAGNSGKGG
ncbi:hypothetical protein Esti_002271 [Eimeria stiedai]